MVGHFTHSEFPACRSRCVAQAFIITQEFLPWLKVSNLGFQVMNHLSARNLIADNKWFAVNQRFCSCNYGVGLSVFLRYDSKVLDICYIVNPKQIKSCWGRVKRVHSRGWARIVHHFVPQCWLKQDINSPQGCVSPAVWLDQEMKGSKAKLFVHTGSWRGNGFPI